jgi:hypothetical protein
MRLTGAEFGLESNFPASQVLLWHEGPLRRNRNRANQRRGFGLTQREETGIQNRA